MRDFHFHTPSSVSEAISLLSQYGEDGRLISGGTALVTMMKQSLVLADHLISLRGIPGLDNIWLESDGVHIGALVNHRAIEMSPVIREHIPLLSEIYGHVATVRIRNQATVGGGLAHGDPAQDPPPGLIVMNAKVKLESHEGSRTLPVADLFRDYYETNIAQSEVLTEVVVPLLPPNASGIYLRYTPQTADDYPTVAVAAVAVMEDEVCRDIALALGATGPTPIQAISLQSALQDQPITANTIKETAELVANEVDPLDDFRGSAEYKRNMAVVFTRRALQCVLKVRP